MLEKALTLLDCTVHQNACFFFQRIVQIKSIKTVYKMIDIDIVFQDGQLFIAVRTF